MTDYDFALRFTLYLVGSAGLVLFFVSLLYVFFLAALPWSSEESDK